MKQTIFDAIEEPIGEGKKGFFDVAERLPEPRDNSFFGTIKEYGKSALKGSAEGLARVGLMMNPIPYTGKSQQEQLQEYTEELNQQVPTPDESFGQRGLRRGLQQAPSALAFPGSAIATLPRAMAAGFLGEGAKDLGAPEWAQTALELTAYIGPDIMKKLLEKGSNAELIAEARKLGLSDEQITPLIQSDFKQKWLSKVSPRRGKTQEVLGETKKGIQEAYSKISESETAKKVLSDEHSIKFIDKVENLFEKMPSGVREKIKTDYKDLLKKDVTGESLINFWGDINHEMGPNSKQLSLLKGPIKDALKEVSPEIAKDFETVNKLYTKFYPISKRLEPNLNTDIMGASKALGSLIGVLTGDYRVMAAAGTHMALGKASQLLLTNPRFQQIGNKFALAVDQNKFTIAKKLVDLLAHELKKSSPEISREIENISEDELMELFSRKKKEK